VFFRAESFDAAANMLHGMTSLTLPWPGQMSSLEWREIFKGYLVPPDSFRYLSSLLGFGILVAGFFPNSQEIMKRIPLNSEPARLWTIGALTFTIFLLVAIGESQGVSEFIYFNF
jgi:hypothetical protein